MKKILLSFVLIVVFINGCNEDELMSPNLGRVNFNIEILKEFTVPSEPFGKLESASAWKHIFETSVTMSITNRTNGRLFTLVFDPNLEAIPSIELPYGVYTFLAGTPSGGDMLAVLPFTMSGEFSVTAALNEVNANVVTDYGLISVGADNVKSISVNDVPLTTMKDGFYYSYFLPGAKKLKITETVFSDVIERDLIIQPYVHFHFILRFVQGSVSFVQLLLTPFDYIEEGIDIASSKDFPPGTPITALAEPNEGYRFSHWEMNNVLFEGGEEITFNMPPYDINLTAFFVIF